MKDKNLQKLADTYTLQKITGAAGYTTADKEVNNNPKTIMNSKFRMKNRLTKNNITRTPIKNRKKAYKEMEKYWDETGYNLFVQSTLPLLVSFAKNKSLAYREYVIQSFGDGAYRKYFEKYLEELANPSPN